MTAEVLKQAAGMVRCGSCGHAFNSLEYLSEQKPGKTTPDPSIPELKPEPQPEPQEPVATEDATDAPQTISTEQSAALLKTLDQLAGDDIRIEDTGVEWRVLGGEDDGEDDSGTTFDPSLSDVSHLDTDTEIDFSDSGDVGEALVESDNTGIWIVGDSRNAGSDAPGVFDDPTETIVDETDLFDTGSTEVDEVLEGAPTPVDEVLEAGGTNIENAELFQTQMMGTTPQDTNAELFQTQAIGPEPAPENAELFRTQMVGTATATESEDLLQPEQIDPPTTESDAGEVDAPAEQMRFDDNTPLPDDFLDEQTSVPEPAAIPQIATEDAHAETHAEPQSPIALSEPDEWEQLLDEFDELLSTDLETSSAVNGSSEADAVDPAATSIEDDLMSAAFENDQPDAALGKDLDASIEEDLMTAAFDIEEAEEDHSSAEGEQMADASDGNEVVGGATTDGELAEASADDVDPDQEPASADAEARAENEADAAAGQELIEAEAQADDVAGQFAETSAELGDVLDEASRLAESLDDESGRFNLDADEAEGEFADARPPEEERRSESSGDESIAEELRAIEEASAAHELEDDDAEELLAQDDELTDEDVEDADLQAQDDDSAAEDAEEAELEALDDESAAEEEQDDLEAADEEPAAEEAPETGEEEQADEELAASDDEEADSLEAADEESGDDEKLDLSTILDPDDEGLIDEGESDPDRDDDDLPELHDVGDHDRPEHNVPPMTEEEETINRLIDQDLLAIAQVDDEGFTSTIVVDESTAPVKVETETVIIGDPEKKEFRGEGQVEESLQLAVDSSGIFGLGTATSKADDESEPSRGRTATIAAVLALLALGLVGQFVHQNRESLATKPAFAGILNSVYEGLGMPITPDWDVSGWNIARTQGATDEQDQLLTIFSEIRNTSETALPYPVVTLSLTDRYQDSVGALILEPGDYLAAGKNTDGLVPPGGKFEAVIPIDEPAQEAVGYTINACYRTPSSDLRCAIADFK